MLRTLLVLLAPALIGARRLAGCRPAGRVRPQARHLHLPERGGPGAVDCFLNAVDHLYTMCRHVKSIEIIEFGYEKSEEGVNGAKSEYCVDKQKINITRPYQAALREATGSKAAVDDLRALYELWMKAIAEPQVAAGRGRQRLQGARRAAVRGVPQAGERRFAPRSRQQPAPSRRQPPPRPPRRRRNAAER